MLKPPLSKHHVVQLSCLSLVLPAGCGLCRYITVTSYDDGDNDGSGYNSDDETGDGDDDDGGSLIVK